MITYAPVVLGQPIWLAQDAAPLYTIDKIFAGAIRDAIEILITEEDIPEGWKGEKCWIDLRIRRWGAIVEFHDRLMQFMDSTAQELQITEAEEILITEIMVCVDTLLSKESGEFESRIEFFATVIGILGGLIGVGVAIGLA